MTTRVLLLVGALVATQRISEPPVEAAIDQAYRSAYNLDHDEAMASVRRAVALAPQSSAAHRALAGVLWLHIAHLRGAVSVDHYLSGVTEGRLAMPKPRADLDTEFKQVLARAIALANEALVRDPRDLGAKYDLGRAYALQASYIASVENSAMSAFRSAMHAYDAAEEVLERDTRHPGAMFVVGTYRYIVSSLSLPTRLLAYIVGFGGGKERGIQMIETAGRDVRTQVDARLALFMIFTREGRHADAVSMVHALSVDYPRNRLFALEEASAAIRADRAGDADALLTRGLDAFDRDSRVKAPGERAMWLYKRGIARVRLKRLAEAQVDLAAALAAEPAGWIRGRIHIVLGNVHDLNGRRPDALVSYRTARSICQASDDPVGVSSANRWIARAFGAAR